MLRRFRARKGFTLIELIVVIAIIGVLAAILVPTLIGYVTQSKVTTVNKDAADLRKHIDAFFTDADAKGYGMKIGTGIVCEPTISVTNGEWAMTITESPLSSIFNNHGGVQWGGSGIGHRDDSKVGKTADELLMIQLAQTYPDIQNSYIGFRMEGGKCVALYCTKETTTPITIQTFGNGGWSSDIYVWDNHQAGVNSQGYIVGTSPVLNFG